MTASLTNIITDFCQSMHYYKKNTQTPNQIFETQQHFCVICTQHSHTITQRNHGSKNIYGTCFYAFHAIKSLTSDFFNTVIALFFSYRSIIYYQQLAYYISNGLAINWFLNFTIFESGITMIFIVLSCYTSLCCMYSFKL